LEFIPDSCEPSVFCELQCGLSLGDAEDHVKIVLKAPHSPTIDIELSDVVAFPVDRWLICGTNGGLTGTEKNLRWKWVDWSTLPVRAVERGPTADRSYNSESLVWHEESWEAPESSDEALAFYTDLFETLRHQAPPVITLESVRRRIAVMEECNRQNQVSPGVRSTV
jgi:scyllo-inositol 2-dehydrogenase (NADP+)